MNIILDTILAKSAFHDKVSMNFHFAMWDVREVLENLTESLNINYHLLLQDEKDRESIYLMGISQNTQQIGYTKKNEVMPITMDKNWLSCSGHVTATLKAFKAACLSYSPSNVKYKGMDLSRLNLLDWVKLSVETLKTKIMDTKFLNSELPDKKIEKAMRSITKPRFEKAPDGNPDSATIPWPKIEGSLPIQSPTSVSPRNFNSSQKADDFHPPIVSYKRRYSSSSQL